MPHKSGTIRRKLAFWQGLYYFLSGVWPVVHMPSFLFITGPKTDLWLVKTVGLLIAVIGLVTLFAARAKNISREIIFLAAGSALVLGLVDVIYVLKSVIRPVYLGDAVIEFVLVLLWSKP